MAREDLKSVFDEFTNIKVDKAFLKSVYGYVQGFINKNDEHTEFFGGNLIGVHRATYIASVDGARWLQEVCGIDEIEDCKEAIDSLEEINPQWIVSSDIVNLSFLYVAHRIYTSDLPSKDKDMGVVYTIIMANAKHLTGGLRRRFPWAANPAIAMAVFESLDYRSDLKKYGSWFALLQNRGEQAIGPKYLHKKVMERFAKTYDVMKWANDIQDRLSDVLTALTARFHEVKDSNARIASGSRMAEYEGVKEIKSYRNVQKDMILGIQRIAVDKNDFIKPELMEDTLDVVNTADPRYLRETLEYINEQYTLDTRYGDMMQDIVIYMFAQAKDSKVDLGNVPELVGKMRSIYRSSRTQRKDVLQIKTQMNDIVESAIPNVRPSVQVATKVAVFIYLVLRIITIKGN